MAWCADTEHGVLCLGIVAVAVHGLVVACTSLDPWLNA